MAAASACSNAPYSFGTSRPSAIPTAATSSTISASPAPPTVDAKAVLSRTCSEIPADQVASLFHSSNIEIEQGPVDQHGPWDAVTCMITGSGLLSLAAFAQIGPPTIAAQDGLRGITSQSDVTDVRQSTGFGVADAAVSFHQKADNITETVVCLAKRTSTSTVVVGVADAGDHGDQPLIQLVRRLGT